MSWAAHYEGRQVSAAEAVTQIRSGDRVVLGHACAEPQALVKALLERAPALHGVEVAGMLSTSPASYCLPEYRGHLRHNTLFAGRSTRRAVNEGTADFTPCYFHQVPALFRDGLLPVDVALITVSPPPTPRAGSASASR